MRDQAPSSWRAVALHVGIVFAIAASGCATAFALWMHDIDSPRISFLGSGDRMSVLVSEGPARIVLATGNNPVAYENAFMSVQPLFARRVDVLLIAGAERSLLVPISAHRDPHVRSTLAVASVPESEESRALGAVPVLDEPKRIQVGPTIELTVEGYEPVGSDPNETFASWRITIERGDTRVVVLSDGSAAGLFPPGPAASVLAVSGENPLEALAYTSAVAVVANADAVDGPTFRDGLAALKRPPSWGFRVAPGDSLNLHLVDGGIELPSDGAQKVHAGSANGMLPRMNHLARHVRQRALPWRG